MYIWFVFLSAYYILYYDAIKRYDKKINISQVLISLNYTRVLGNVRDLAV